MPYYRVWLTGGRSVRLEGDALEVVDAPSQGFASGDIVIRKNDRVIGHFEAKAVDGYNEYEPPSPAFPRLAKRRFARYFPPVLLSNLVRRMVWRFQNPSSDV
jgi:hypothetical protein